MDAESIETDVGHDRSGGNEKMEMGNDARDTMPGDDPYELRHSCQSSAGGTIASLRFPSHFFHFTSSEG
jgi:hypothetical protein